MRLQSKSRHIAACTTASLALAAAILLTGCGGGGGGAPAPSNSTSQPSSSPPQALQARPALLRRVLPAPPVPPPAQNRSRLTASCGPTAKTMMAPPPLQATTKMPLRLPLVK